MNRLLLFLSVALCCAQSDDLLRQIEFARNVEEALAIASQTPATGQLASRLTGFGSKLYNDGNYPSAERLHQAALAVAIRAHDDLSAARASVGIGLCYRRKGQQLEVIRSSEEGLKFALAAADKQTISDLNLLSGIGHRAIGETQIAIAAFTRARDACEEIHNVACAVGAINNIGLAQMDLGEYQTAATTFHDSLPRAVNTVHESTFLNNLAVSYGDQGDWQTALVYFERALALSRKQSDQHRIAIALINVSEVYEVRNMLPEGFSTAAEAIRLAAQINRPRVLGLAYMSRGRLNRLAGKYDAALADFQLALDNLKADGQTNQVAKSLALIASLHYAQGHDDLALDYARKALTEATAAGYNEILRASFDIFAMVHRRAGRRAEAKAAFEQEIEILEAASTKITGGDVATLYLAEKMNPYYGLMEIDIEEQQNELALRTLERAKARRLLDVVTNGRASLSRNITAAERRQEQKLSEDVEAKTIAALRPDATNAKAQLETAQRELTAFRAILYTAHPELKLRRDESAPFSLLDAGSLLPPKTALIEYAFFGDRLFLFVLARSNPQAPPTLHVTSKRWPSPDVTRDVEAFREALAGRRLSYRTSAQALYQYLIAPVAADLKGKSTLGIIPDGVLWNVPFQALLQPNGRHLLEDQAIFYAPSLTVLREASRSSRRTSGQTTRFVAFGAPSLGRFAGSLAPDPESGREVEQIGALYKGVVHTADAASKTAWRAEAPGADVLHIATHGILNTANPLYSYLVLSDGVIEAREILDMNLRARLVVLSACESGLGSISPGEGLIGMSWAFLLAGSRTTLVSQWKVDSASTGDLMLRFHRSLRTTDDVAVALQRAALETMRMPGFRHPFYWAGFVSVGQNR